MVIQTTGRIASAIPPKRCAFGGSQRFLLQGLRPFSFPSAAWPFGPRSEHGDLTPVTSLQQPLAAARSGISRQSRWGHLASTVRSWFPSIRSDAITPSPSSDADGDQVPFPPRAAACAAALEMEVGLAPFQPPSPPLPAVPSPPDPHSSRSTRERRSGGSPSAHAGQIPGEM